MYGLERNHFAVVLPGNSNLIHDQTLNLPEDGFPLCPAVKICALKDFIILRPSVDGREQETLKKAETIHYLCE